METQNSAYDLLFEGVRTLDFKGDIHPCELLLIGNNAFPLAVNSNGQVLAAAACYGKGRIVATSHEGYLQVPSWTHFLKNVTNWLKGSASTCYIGVHPSLAAFQKQMEQSGVCDKFIASEVMQRGMIVYCTAAYHNGHEADRLVMLVKNGGGLLIGGQAKNWALQNPTKDILTEFPGNSIASVGGIYFTVLEADKELIRISHNIPPYDLVVPDVRDFSTDLKVLLHGIQQYDLESNNSTCSVLFVHGNLAFPVVTDENLQAGVAAAHFGKGRVVVVSHESQFSHPSQQPFIRNALKWLRHGQTDGSIALHTSLKENTELHSFLSQTSFTVSYADDPADFNVFCCTTYEPDLDPNVILEFVAEGGGLLIGGQAWSWVSSNPTLTLLQHYPGNQVLSQFGISVLADYFPSQIIQLNKDDLLCPYHFREVLHAVVKAGDFGAVPEPFRRKFTYDASQFLRVKSCSIAQFDVIHQALCDLLSDCSAQEPCEECPVKDSRDLMILTMAAFAPHSLNRICIDGNNPGEAAWRSTGLYAPPKTAIRITVPLSIVNQEWQIQIGSHSDGLLEADELKRPPLIVQTFRIVEESFIISGKYGGLIYVVVPAESSMGVITIAVEDATKAPYYKAGETNVSEWKNKIRKYHAPWAEIEAENIIFTVPADAVRSIENPEALTDLWDRIMRAIAKLAAIPERFPRPERIVADVQISAGWMHAGYPIMAHVDSVNEMINLDYIQKNYIWGLIHELGHNQQRPLWDFPPHTTEATCNLWSIYVHEEVFGISRSKAHEELQPEARRKRIEKYINDGAKLDDYEMFTCLETYLQLQEAFGWEPYMRIFAHYQKLTRQLDDTESKMNYWARHFSREVDKNLAPFFQAWGWPLTQKVIDKLSVLPTWNENPMLKYIRK